MTESTSSHITESYNSILKKRSNSLNKKFCENCPSVDEILRNLLIENKQFENRETLDEIPSALRPGIQKYGVQSIASSDTEPCSGICLNCPWYCSAGQKSNRIMKKCSSICKFCPWSDENRDEVFYN